MMEEGGFGVTPQESAERKIFYHDGLVDGLKIAATATAALSLLALVLCMKLHVVTIPWLS